MKLINNKLLIICSILISAVYSAAAQNEISGTVVDYDNFELPGVSVYVEGTQKGTTTDFYGKYSIEIGNITNGVLVFEYLGLKTKKIPIVNGINEINVTLEADNKTLNEVIVVGYGTQNKKDVTGAVALVKSDVIEDRSNTRVESLLQGQAAGVQVVANSGKPNSSFSVRVRGTSSINSSSEPIYVVDGVQTTDIRSINPSDIDTITVLKDASSAAIYGAQGASGVVLITTKRGTTSKPKVTLDVYTGISQVSNTLPVLNGEQYLDLAIELGETPNFEELNANTDWQDLLFQDGLTTNYQAAVSGKSDKTNYYISAGFLDVEGAVRSSEVQRANFKINLDQEINDNVKVGTRIAYTKYNDVDVTDNARANQGGVILGALTTPSVITPTNDDGTFRTNPFLDIENPLAGTDGLVRGFESNRFLGNIYAEISFFKNFKFKSSYGIEDNSGIFESFLDPRRTTFGASQQGRAVRNTDQREFNIFDNTLNYSNTIGNHKIEGLVGYVVQETFEENTEILTTSFSNSSVTTINGGAITRTNNLSNSLRKNNSFISRVNYNYDNRYLFTANFRADGSSVFGPNNRIGYFPSFSAGWRVSNEKFFEKFSSINDLKIRAGWGIVGNDRISDAFASQQRVGVGANFPIDGTNASPGTFPESPGNPSLKWEETTQQNIGIDLALFDNRIKITTDAYIKDTNDLFLDVPLPSTTGFDSGIANIGSVQNKGVEFTLQTSNIEKENFNWSSNFNISFNKNEITALNSGGADILRGNVAGRGQPSLLRVGESIGLLYGFIYGGVDPVTGDAFYIDRNGNSTFTPDEDEDRTIIGDSNPDFIYSFTNNFSYKNIDLSVFIQGSQGNDILNATRIETEGLLEPINQSRAVLRRWRNPGDITDIPRAVADSFNNSRISTRFIEDASFARLKAVTLSYNFPSELIKKLKMTSLKIYGTAENLLTLTNYSGFDPEVNFNSDDNAVRGIDFGTFPQTRNLIFGLNVAF